VATELELLLHGVLAQDSADEGPRPRRYTMPCDLRLHIYHSDVIRHCIPAVAWVIRNQTEVGKYMAAPGDIDVENLAKGLEARRLYRATHKKSNLTANLPSGERKL